MGERQGEGGRLKSKPLTEFGEQALTVTWWASYCRTKGLDERLLMSSMGGSVLAGDAKQRGIQMARAKASGYRAGTPDLMLAVPKKSEGVNVASINGDPTTLRLVRDKSGPILFSGLFIEMKRKDAPKPPPAQLEMAALLRRQGYNCVIAKGFEEARRAIQGYLEA